jgi:hypothetical protein
MLLNLQDIREPADGGCRFLQNTDTNPPNYTESHSTRQQFQLYSGFIVSKDGGRM